MGYQVALDAVFRKYVQHHFSVLDLVQCKIIDPLNVEEFLVEFYELLVYQSKIVILHVCVLVL